MRWLNESCCLSGERFHCQASFLMEMEIAILVVSGMRRKLFV
jgi:hypothetical protein